jgi:hypothetical protein
VQPHCSWRRAIRCHVRSFAFLSICCLPAQHALLAESQAHVELSQTTKYLIFTRDWWPRTGTPPSEAYAGSQSCQQCHKEESLTQLTTPMAQASYRSAVGPWGARLKDHTASVGAYRYYVVPLADDSKVIVESGKQSVRADIAWTFGAGVRGQTFVLENKGELYDSQVSSFPSLHGGLTITPAHQPAQAGDWDEALGQKLTPETAPRCFSCHTTASTTKNQFDTKSAIPGIMCESCHGPGLAHVVAANMNRIDDAEKLIFNPRSLDPVESADFCGACHMTSADVVESNLFVPSNVRFAPYRLEKSRCWGVRGDQRLVCFTCHNPHKPLVREASFYDQRCLSCHSSKHARLQGTSDSVPKVCPKATANCTTCHMPKYYVPEMHANFTDHFIRIVRSGDWLP